MADLIDIARARAQVNCCDPVVDPFVYVPDPDRPGMSKLVRTKTVRGVFEELVSIVGEYPYGGEDYFVVVKYGAISPEDEWPAKAGDRLIIYTVHGSNEGDYTHVDLVLTSGKVRPLFMAKTFAGRDASWTFARTLADLLGV